MPSLRYKDYYISVFHLPDKSGKSSCIPFVEIRHKRERVLTARLMLTESFATEHAATAHGFTAGREWVDQQSTSKSVVAAPSAESEPLRFRLKSWLLSHRMIGWRRLAGLYGNAETRVLHSGE